MEIQAANIEPSEFSYLVTMFMQVLRWKALTTE